MDAITGWVKQPKPAGGLDHQGYQAPCIMDDKSILSKFEEYPKVSKGIARMLSMWSFYRDFVDHALKMCRNV